MNSKTRKSKVFITGGVAGLVVIVFVGSILLKENKPGSIPLFSTVEEAKAISGKNKKDKCLPNNESVADAINKDDTIESYEYEGKVITYSNYEVVAVAGFRDIPAGTNGEVAKNSYDGQIATGSIVYEQNYGSYNYSIKRLPDSKQWELTTLIACEM